MAIFNQQMTDAGSGYQPIVTPTDTTIPDAIGQLGNLVKPALKAKEAQIEAQDAAGTAGLFSDTLKGEAEALQGQEFLKKNQEKLDQLYSDGTITADEQKQLKGLMEDRARLENITNSRQRQVRLRMKYANFVNRYPHLTKEARIMFGEADSRLADIAQGNQDLVDKAAFEEIYGKAYTAENVTAFRSLQKWSASRQVGATYGQANFQDWGAGFTATVSGDLYTVGKRMEGLFKQQGSLRQDDIDVFTTSIEEGYISAVQQIDSKVVEMQKNGMYVSPDQVKSLKQQLQDTRDQMLGMTKDKDFLTRLQRFNTGMEEHFKASMNINMSALAKLYAGEGGGGSKGAADIATIKQLLADAPGVDAAKSLPGPYGDQVRMLQQGAVEYLNFLDNYDKQRESAAQYISPSMYRQLAQVQAMRIDNGITQEKPEAVKTWLDLMDQGGTSDEQAQAILSRAKTVDVSAIKNNEVKAKIQSFVNNYNLETEQILKGVGAKVRQTNNGYEAYVTGPDGKPQLFKRGTDKLNNLAAMYNSMPSVGSAKDFNTFVDNYKNTINSEVQSMIDSLNLGGMTKDLQEMTIRRLQTMYSLTPEEVQQIKDQIRSSDG